MRHGPWARLQCVCRCRATQLFPQASCRSNRSAFVTTAGVRTANDGVNSIPHNTVKRKVAIHFGYVGTGFRGLQFLRDSESDAAIEDVLEKAILKSGGILPTNAGHSHKTGWSRSSRTDKGVHSLSTVVGMKLECEDDIFLHDPEGQTLAAAINQHLPEQIRVFSVQRTHNAFDARQQCQDRTYHYHLPAAVLGLSGGSQDADILERLTACLDLFNGSHPFHNFTERKRYRTKQQQKLRAKARQLWQAQHRGAAGPRGHSSVAGKEPGGVDSCQQAQRPKLWWLHEPVEWDQLSDAHYRFIKAAEAGPPHPLTDGGKPYLTILLRGSSFMVYQIRHMVAAAVCVATHRLPLALIKACLCQHARVDLPLAPPQGLLLADSCFYDFPTAGGATHPVTALSGTALQLRRLGQERRAAFCRQTLHPALDAELRSLDWSAWAAELDRGVQYDPEEAQSVLDAHTRWKTRRDEDRVLRQATGTASAA